MHPLSVVTLVIGISFRTDPTGPEQRTFNFWQARSLDHEVYVRKQSPIAGGQMSHKVSGTFKHDHRSTDVLQCAPDAVDLPLHLMMLAINQSQRTFKVLSRLIWHGGKPIALGMMLRQTPQQSGLPGLSQQDLPLRRCQVRLSVWLRPDSRKEIGLQT